jgi:hypothetical protein
MRWTLSGSTAAAESRLHMVSDAQPYSNLLAPCLGRFQGERNISKLVRSEIIDIVSQTQVVERDMSLHQHNALSLGFSQNSLGECW